MHHSLGTKECNRARSRWWRGQESSGCLAFARVEIGPQIVAGDAGQAFDFEDAFSGNGPPLTDGTRRYTKRVCKVTAATSFGV